MATLKITVHEARDLPVMDRASGLADPYVVLRLDDMEHTTEIARHTLNPVWNRDYRFDAPDLIVLQEDPLEVRVYDHDIISRDDLVGTVWVDCNVFVYRRYPVVTGWFPLLDTIEGMRGEIRLTIRVKFHGADNPMRPQVPERLVRRLEPGAVVASREGAQLPSPSFASATTTATGWSGGGAPQGSPLERHNARPRDEGRLVKLGKSKIKATGPGGGSSGGSSGRAALGVTKTEAVSHGRSQGLYGTTASLTTPLTGATTASSFSPGYALSGSSFDVSGVQQLLLRRLNSSAALLDQNSFAMNGMFSPAFGDTGMEAEMGTPLTGATAGGGGSNASHPPLLPFFMESDTAPIPAVRAQQPNLAGEEESVLMFSVWRLDPAILRVERVASMVEELIVKADPEHSRLTNLRSSRSTHEARVTQLFKLSGKVRRQLSRKVVELQCNAVLGYSEAFDIEPSSIIVRAYGTPCVVSSVRYVEERVPRPLLHAVSSQFNLWNSFAGSPGSASPWYGQQAASSFQPQLSTSHSYHQAPAHAATNSGGGGSQGHAHHFPASASATTMPPTSTTAAAAAAAATGHTWSPLTSTMRPDGDALLSAELLPPPATAAAAEVNAMTNAGSGYGSEKETDQMQREIASANPPLIEMSFQPLSSPRAPTVVPVDSRQLSRTSPPLLGGEGEEEYAEAAPPLPHAKERTRSSTYTQTPVHTFVTEDAPALPLLSHVPTPSSTANNSFVGSGGGVLQSAHGQGQVLVPYMVVHSLQHAAAAAAGGSSAVHPNMRTPLMAPMLIDAGNSPYGALMVGDVSTAALAGMTGPSVATHTTAPPTATQSELEFANAAFTNGGGLSPSGSPRLLTTSVVAAAAAAASGAANATTSASPQAGAQAQGSPAGPALASSRSAVLILTVKDMPSDVVQHIGGHICSRSVKIVSKMKSKQIISQERDAWWMELREELRANARSFHCNAILGYEEETQYLEDVVLLSLYGTAVMIDLALLSLRAGPDLIYRRARDKVETRRNCSLLHLYHGSQHRAAMLTEVADILHHSVCNVCHHKPVPDVLLASCTLPVDLSCEGPPRLVHVTVSRQKRHDIKGPILATTVSQALPFIEYSLHKQLLFQLRLMGLNACFGMRVSIVLGPDVMVGTLTGTGCRLVGLPMPVSPRLEVLDPAIARSETVMRLKDVIIKRSQAKTWRKRQHERRRRREHRERHRRGAEGDAQQQRSSSSRASTRSSSAASSAVETSSSRGSSSRVAVGESGTHNKSKRPSHKPRPHRTRTHPTPPQQPQQGQPHRRRRSSGKERDVRKASARPSNVHSMLSSRAASSGSSASSLSASSSSGTSRGRMGSTYDSRSASSSTRSSVTSGDGSRSSSSSSSFTRTDASESTWMHSLTDSDSSDELHYRPIQEAVNSRIVDYVVKVDDEEEADLMLGMADETTFEDSILLTIPYVADSASIFDWQERIIMHRRYTVVAATTGGLPLHGTASAGPVWVNASGGIEGLGEGGGGGGGPEPSRYRYTHAARFTNRALNDCCADAKRAFAQTVCRLAMRHDARPERLRVFDFTIFTFFEPHSGDLHLRLEGTLMLSSAASRVRLMKLEDRAFRVCLQSALLADPMAGTERPSSAIVSPMTAGAGSGAAAAAAAAAAGLWDGASHSSYHYTNSVPSSMAPVAGRGASSGSWGTGQPQQLSSSSSPGLADPATTAAAAMEGGGAATSEGHTRGSAAMLTSLSSPDYLGASTGMFGSGVAAVTNASSGTPHSHPLSAASASAAANANAEAATTLSQPGLSRSSPEYLIYHFYRRLFTSRLAPFSLPYTVNPSAVEPLRVWVGGGVGGGGGGDAQGDEANWATARVAGAADGEEEDRRTYTDYRHNMSTRTNAVSRHVQSFFAAAANSLRSLAERTNRHLHRDDSTRRRFLRSRAAAAAAASAVVVSVVPLPAEEVPASRGLQTTVQDVHARLHLGPSGALSGAALSTAMDPSLHQPSRRLPADLRTLAEWLPPVIVTPVDYVAGRAIVRYLGRLSHHFIREQYAAGSPPAGSASYYYYTAGLVSSTQSPLGAFFQQTEMEMQCCVEALVRLAGGNALLKHRVTVHEVSDSDGSGSAFLFATVTGDIVQVTDVAAASSAQGNTTASPPSSFVSPPTHVEAAAGKSGARPRKASGKRDAVPFSAPGHPDDEVAAEHVSGGGRGGGERDEATDDASSFLDDTELLPESHSMV